MLGGSWDTREFGLEKLKLGDNLQKGQSERARRLVEDLCNIHLSYGEENPWEMEVGELLNLILLFCDLQIEEDRQKVVTAETRRAGFKKIHPFLWKVAPLFLLEFFEIIPSVPPVRSLYEVLERRVRALECFSNLRRERDGYDPEFAKKYTAVTSPLKKRLEQLKPPLAISSWRRILSHRLGPQGPRR